jgi:hypothetical protein
MERSPAIGPETLLERCFVGVEFPAEFGNGETSMKVAVDVGPYLQ